VILKDEEEGGLCNVMVMKTLWTAGTIVSLTVSMFVQSQEEAEREVAEFLMKALKYCDLDTPGPHQPIYQFRAATIHHRLASLYHKSYR
jgi:hypothetical protein